MKTIKIEISKDKRLYLPQLQQEFIASVSPSFGSIYKEPYQTLTHVDKKGVETIIEIPAKIVFKDISDYIELTILEQLVENHNAEYTDQELAYMEQIQEYQNLIVHVPFIAELLERLSVLEEEVNKLKGQ